MPTGGTPGAGDVTQGLTQKAINREAAGGKAVPPDAGAVAVDYAKATRTTPAPAVLRVDFKAGKKTAGKRESQLVLLESAVPVLRGRNCGFFETQEILQRIKPPLHDVVALFGAFGAAFFASLFGFRPQSNDQLNMEMVA